VSRRDEFIRAVALYLTTSVMCKSNGLRMGNPDSIAWARAYQAAGCGGQATAEEAEAAIRSVLAESEVAG